MPERGRYTPLTREEAVSTQLRLRDRCIRERVLDTREIRIVAGADAAYSYNRIFGAIVCVSFPDGEILEHAVQDCPLAFPYIPGLFAFRELPSLVAAFHHLTILPDIILAEGHGYAHPRRFGLASHLGVVLDVPSIGVAKNLLTGIAEEPGPERRSMAPVMEHDEVLGVAIRSKESARPVYVSAGHKTDLAQAVTVVLQMTGNFRMPDPLIAADRLARQARNA
ncbi:MAG TPA: endonuclease V [Methanoregulaceae archaeon]|nr:endonuclease V [Methanoregulaceae archaeon]